MPNVTPEQLWADFNGRNHAELAIKYRLSLQAVYRLIRKAHQAQQRRDGIRRLQALLDDRPANASLTTPVLVDLARRAWALKAYRLSLRLLWRLLDSPRWPAIPPYRLHGRQLVQTLKALAQSGALQVLAAVRSFHSPNQR